MAWRGIVAFVVLFLVAGAGLPGEARAEEPGFAIERFAVARDVENLEPVGEATAFPASTETVYAFLETRDIKQNAEVAMVWLHEGKEVALVTLLVRKAPRWRTFSSKTVAGRKGRWEVALRDAEGRTLRTAAFTVK